MRRPGLRYVSREEWGAQPPKSKTSIPTPTRLWLHHTASAFPTDPTWRQRLFLSSAKEFVRGVQRFHMDGRGWNDIAYTQVVLKPFLGKMWIFEGRGFNVQGAHTEGDNSSSYGIAVAGNFSVEKVRRGLKRGLREHFDRLVRNGRVKAKRESIPTGGHQDAPGAATACPGTGLQAALPTFRRPFSDTP